MERYRTDKTIVLNSRVNEDTLEKFYDVWRASERSLPTYVRLKKQDVFALIINEYYNILKEKGEL